MSPDQKKQKIDVARLVSAAKPSVYDGILSASASARKNSESEPLKIPIIELKDPSSFFNNPGDINDCCAINSDLFDQWDDKNYLEDNIRNDVFRQLKSSGLLFPNASENAHGEYSEKWLKTIFTEYAMNNKHKTKQIGDTEQGLRVKLSSKPDLCILRDDNIIVGELKQLGYSTGSAADQGSLHVLAVLYFFRVILGFPVDEAYGFWVCGPNCSNLQKGEYAIGLLRVKAPAKIGEPFLAEQWSQTYETKKPDGVKILINFLKKGKKMNLNDHISLKSRIPARFALPSSLWNERDAFKLVHSGNSAIVFKVQKDGLRNFVMKNVYSADKHEEKKKTKYAQQLAKLLPNNVYVKVRTKDTSQHYGEPYFFLGVRQEISEDSEDGTGDAEELDALSDFLGTYISKPYVGISFCLYVMADRGVPCAVAAPQIAFVVMIKKLKKLWKRMKIVNVYLHHGDALLHNIVYGDDEEFHLIDYDEATVPNDSKGIPGRGNNYTGKFPWFQAMMYPNALRSFGEKYTQVQFMTFVFIAIATWAEIPSEQQSGLMFFTSMDGSFQQLGRILQDNDSPESKWDQGSLPEAVDQTIQSFYENLHAEWAEI